MAQTFHLVTTAGVPALSLTLNRPRELPLQWTDEDRLDLLKALKEAVDEELDRMELVVHGEPLPPGRRRNGGA